MFLFGKPFREMLDVQACSRFRCRYPGETQGLGWTQAELATRFGTGERFIVELESGKPSCQLEKSFVVARTVGIEIGDLRIAQDAPTSPDDDRHFLPTFGYGR